MSCCRKRKALKKEAQQALLAFLDSPNRSLGGHPCCRKGGKTCPIKDCGARVQKAWFAYKGISLAYDKCSMGHKVRLG